MNRVVVSTVALVFVTLAQTEALAQRAPEGRTWFQEPVPAPRSAFELTVASGYTQGFGMLRGGTGLRDVATPGIAFELGAGYRIDSRWALNLRGQYHELAAQRSDGARGAIWGLAVSYHGAPEMRLDPWLEVGGGYRLLAESGNESTPRASTHGFQLARAMVGIDFRVSADIAVAPLVGVDANLFLWQDRDTTTSTFTAIDDPRVNTFVFAGVQGRIDIGGTRVAGTTITSAPVATTSEAQCGPSHDAANAQK